LRHYLFFFFYGKTDTPLSKMKELLLLLLHIGSATSAPMIKTLLLLLQQWRDYFSNI